MSWWRRTAPQRWAVVDVETSGLDTERDRLIAIAGVGVRLEGDRLVLAVADSFEVVLAAPASAALDKPNVLVHGIGLGAQRAGMAPEQAVAGFERWRAGAPLVAFHAAFDRRFLQRARAAPPSRDWLDLAELAPALQPGTRAQALDDWLALHGITVAERHRAISDAWATAELLQRLWAQAHAQGASSFGDLQRLAGARRWLPT